MSYFIQIFEDVYFIIISGSERHNLHIFFSNLSNHRHILMDFSDLLSFLSILLQILAYIAHQLREMNRMSSVIFTGKNNFSLKIQSNVVHPKHDFSIESEIDDDR